MTLLHCVYNFPWDFFFFNQVYFPFESDFQCPEVFFSAVFIYLTEFSEVGATEISQHGVSHWTKTLYTTYIKWKT